MDGYTPQQMRTFKAMEATALRPGIPIGKAVRQQAIVTFLDWADTHFPDDAIFATVTWYSNGHCTFHNIRDCPICQGFPLRCDGNTAAADPQPDREMPIFNAWRHFRQIYARGTVRAAQQAASTAAENEAAEIFEKWKKDHCDGQDPFYTITWYRNHYCTRHNVARCDDCQKNYDKMSDKNMAAAEADKVTARPRDDGYEYFRSIYDQGTVEEKKEKRREEEKQQRDREAQAQAQAQPAAGFNAGYAAPTSAPYDPPYITQPNLNHLAIPPSSRPAPPTQVRDYNIWLKFGLQAIPSRVTVQGDKTVRALITEHGSNVNENLWLWSASRREWDTLYSFRTMRELVEEAGEKGYVLILIQG
ncbi:hypothetical protein LTR56_013042 [Elasticomyces elasticus]|nr:hypothetical protein LTR22_025140 [Elasticomyces elasticus]KAK3638402.1 hypothetical protein LTR56_013042 [Elasticomyces elasticus]KAK4920498.1 hypothetical protein LTR49_011913 [Elasticomyces elasticus]KAK5759001.1 hypothetical protein LTS12_010942 [Elasticomyces elasticus]